MRSQTKPQWSLFSISDSITSSFIYKKAEKRKHILVVHISSFCSNFYAKMGVNGLHNSVLLSTTQLLYYYVPNRSTWITKNTYLPKWRWIFWQTHRFCSKILNFLYHCAVVKYSPSASYSFKDRPIRPGTVWRPQWRQIRMYLCTDFVGGLLAFLVGQTSHHCYSPRIKTGHLRSATFHSIAFTATRTVTWQHIINIQRHIVSKQ